MLIANNTLINFSFMDGFVTSWCPHIPLFFKFQEDLSGNKTVNNGIMSNPSGEGQRRFPIMETNRD